MSTRKVQLRASAALLAIASVAAAADPVEIDGPNWHAIVIRPVDLWVGDATARANSLDEVRSHKANYRIMIRGQERQGGRLLFQGPDKDPLIDAINNELQRADFSLGLSQEYRVLVEGCEYFDADHYPAFADFQGKFYRDEIRREGDPDSLEGRIRGHKILGNVLAVASIGIAGGHFGAGAAGGIAGSTIPSDIADATRAAASSGIPALLPQIDLSNYDTVSVRRIDYTAGMNGQILIALKKGWKQEDEDQALAKVVPVALGVGDTPEAIEASRAKDFAYRKQVWDQCVAAGECQVEAKPHPVGERP